MTVYGLSFAEKMKNGGNKLLKKYEPFQKGNILVITFYDQSRTHFMFGRYFYSFSCNNKSTIMWPFTLVTYTLPMRVGEQLLH